MAIAIKEGVKGVEKLLLGAILTREELHVIDQQAIRLAETATKLYQLPMLDGGDKLIRKLFRGNINDLGTFLFLHDSVPDCVKQMGFP